MGILTPLHPQKIVILRPLQFGDLMCSVPALRALRHALPDADITLVGLPWAASFVKRFSQYVDHFVEFPGFPGFPEQKPRITELPDFLQKIQGEHFDLALQMQGSGNLSNSIVELFGANQTAGFYLEGQYCPDPDAFLLYPLDESEIWRHLKLMQFLGVPLQGDQLEFPIFENEWRAFSRLRKALKLGTNEYVVIHPGARAAERRWAPEKFAAVGDRLAREGFQIVLTGTKEETAIVEAVKEKMVYPAVDTCGRTTPGTLAALLSGARMLVCNDTGVSHMAAALRIPSVVLFSASEPRRWAPLDKSLHRRVCKAKKAGPEAVLREAGQILREERVYAA